MDHPAYEAWAEILRYPGQGRAARLPEWVAEAGGGDARTAEALGVLLDYVREHDEGEVEEAFVRTFENNSERALELGWHLHGENYARGNFMVRLRQLHARAPQLAALPPCVGLRPARLPGAGPWPAFRCGRPWPGALPAGC